jgi:hypothetical protein
LDCAILGDDGFGFTESADGEGGLIAVAPACTAAVLLCTTLAGGHLISVAPACTAAVLD